MVEIKSTEDGGHMELQAIRYAAMVSSMNVARGGGNGLDPVLPGVRRAGSAGGENPARVELR